MGLELVELRRGIQLKQGKSMSNTMESLGGTFVQSMMVPSYELGFGWASSLAIQKEELPNHSQGECPSLGLWIVTHFLGWWPLTVCLWFSFSARSVTCISVTKASCVFTCARSTAPSPTPRCNTVCPPLTCPRSFPKPAEAWSVDAVYSSPFSESTQRIL